MRLSNKLSMLRWAFCILVLVGSMAVALHAQSAAAPELPPCLKQDGSLGVRWIVNAGSLKRSSNAIPVDVQRRYFGTRCTFLTGMARNPSYQDWNAINTMSITDASKAEQCCGNEPVRAILYDPEAWEFTPRDQQLHPAEYACKLAAIVHAQHRLLIVTPATNLIGVIDPSSKANHNRYDRFVAVNIAGGMARCADVYEILAQGSEMNTAKFSSYVHAIAAQARRANPNIVLLAGISTNPSGQKVTADGVYAAVKSVSDVVSGYWLNIPAGGAYCPRCGEPQPEVAARLLQLMSK